MSDYGYRASVYRDADSWAKDTVRLLVRRRVGVRTEYLRSDGAWQSVEDGAEIGVEIGLPLPAECIEAIAQAIQEFQGHASHADTEARVLREWLAVERARVDKAMDR